MADQNLSQENFDGSSKKGQNFEEEMGEKLNDIKKDSSEAAGTIKEGGLKYAKGKMHQMADQMRDQAHHLQDQAHYWKECTESYVKDNPMKAVGIAALAGMAVAFLLRGK